MNTNSEGTTSSFSKTSRTVVSFPIAFSKERNVKSYMKPYRRNYLKYFIKTECKSPPLYRTRGNSVVFVSLFGLFLLLIW